MSRSKMVSIAAGALLVIAVLLYFLFPSVTAHRADGSASMPNGNQPVVSLEMRLLQKDELLHTRLRELLELDERYAALLGDPGSSRVILDSVQVSITGKEKRLGLFISSMESGGRININSVSGNMQDNIISSFKKELAQRGLTRMVAAGVHSMEDTFALTGGSMSLEYLRLDNLKKDARILEMERQLRMAYPGYVKSQASDSTDDNNNLFVVKDRLRRRDAAYAELQERYEKLRQLTTLMNPRPGGEKIDDPQSPVHDSPPENVTGMDAALLLAQVDCNLTRADGRTIIYNSKQRKALLEESLRILNSLVSSGNASLQKQVRDRMKALDEIATMIRD